MGKNRHLFILILVLSCPVSWHGLVLPAQASSSPPSDQSVNPESAVLQEILNRALEEADRTGKSTIDIDLDAELEKVWPGDLLMVHYTAISDDQVLLTTVEGIARDPNRRKVDGYYEPAHFAPDLVVAGGRNRLPGLGEAVIGMTVGERKTITLPPAKCFGLRDEARLVSYPTTKTIPRIIHMTSDEYVEFFKSSPLTGKKVQINPYLAATVQGLSENGVTLEVTVEDDEALYEDFGRTEVRVGNDKIILTLHPRLGAIFALPHQKGSIVAVENGSFTVDFNHPLAGKPLIFDLEIISRMKATTLAGVAIPWEEDYRRGLALARSLEKPSLVVLYSHAGDPCRLLFGETLRDPRIRLLKDRFVWIKVNSETHPEIDQIYGQHGIPLLVLHNSAGAVVTKMNGFRDAATLREELDHAAAMSMRNRSR